MDLIFFTNPITNNRDKKIKVKKVKSAFVDTVRSQKNSISRSKKKIYDIARANSWDYFITLTLSPDKVDRENYDEISKKLSQWLKNVRKRKAKNLKYIIIPELHKDGKSYHFHGLIANVEGLKIVESIVSSKVFNLPDYKLGFSVALPVRDNMRVANYITKYISKQLGVINFAKKRYWASNNLDLPQVSIDFVSYTSFFDTISSHNIKYKKVVEIDEQGYKNTIFYFTV